MRKQEDELFRMAFIYAEQDRAAFVECYPENSREPAVVEARNLLKRLRAYRLKRWGKTQHEETMDRADAVSIEQLRKSTHDAP